MIDVIQVTTTVAKKEDAEKLAGILVEKRLAACVQITGPMTSVYEWAGKIETAVEFLLCIKSGRHLYAELEQEISARHPYEVPEIIVISVSGGAKPYLAWLEGVLR